MQITPITGGSLSGAVNSNNDYDSTQITAEASDFQSTLDKLTAKINAADADCKKNSAPTTQADFRLTADEEAKRAKELREACQGFEAMFLSLMYKQMRATVPENELFGSSNAIKIFEDMRDTEMMDGVAKSGGIGIADMMYKQLSATLVKKQER